MRMWVQSIGEFWYAIWHHIQHIITIEQHRFGERYVSLDVPFNIFRIFGFLDDTGFRTTAPGRGLHRFFEFVHDLQ